MLDDGKVDVVVIVDVLRPPRGGADLHRLELQADAIEKISLLVEIPVAGEKEEEAALDVVVECRSSIDKKGNKKGKNELGNKHNQRFFCCC